MSDPNQEFHAPPAPVIEDQKVVRATKLLPYAIGLFVIGVIVCVAGIIKLIPGGIGTGAAFAFWGILLFAYSFIPLPQSKGDFRIGHETYSKKLLYDEMVDTPLDQLLQIGYDDLRKNQTFRDYDDRYHITAKLKQQAQQLPSKLGDAARSAKPIPSGRKPAIASLNRHSAGGFAQITIARTWTVSPD